jgi:LmeA-like phospholipid-binding
MGRGRKAGIALLVVLLVLIGGLVAADRIAANAAEGAIADQTAKEMQARGMSTPSEPDVSIGGFPFLTQVVGGVYEKITIDIDQPQAQQVKIDNLNLVATDVRAAASDLINGRGDIVATTLSGTATLGWDSVRSLIELAGLPSAFDPSQLKVTGVDDNVELRLPVTVAGVTFTLVAKGTLTVADGRVRLQLTDVGSEGVDSSLIRTAISGFRDRLTATIRVPQMPYRLVIKKVETTSSGVLVTATAADVKLAG